MSTKNDGPDKTPRPAEAPAAASGSASGAKKPYATIDLKAVEVKDAGKSSEPAKPEPGKSDTKSGDKPHAVLTGTAPPAGAKPADTKADTKPADQKADAGKTGAPVAAAKIDTKPEAKPAATRPAPEPAKRSGGGVGSFFTHLAAGIVGGFLALLGADTIGQKLLPELGLPAPQAALNETAADLQRRIAALESTSAKSASSDAAQKIAALEARIAKFDADRAATAKVAADALSLAGKAEKGGTETAEPRLAKLEEKLQGLVALAGTEPEKAGRIPALAAVSGKISDLETTMGNQLAAVRKSISEQIDARIAAVSEASEQARTGTQRLDRDVSTLKTDSARLKSDTDRISVGLKTAQDDIAAAKGGLDALKSDIDARLKAAAKPADVSAAVAPVATKLSALEGSVDSVVKSEQSRKANAERIVLSLELGNLKRVLDRGAPFAAELGEVKKAAGGKIDFTALERYKDNGVATVADLTRDFDGISNAVLDADAEQTAGSGVVDRLMAGAKSVVRVRKVGVDASATGTEATLGRMEAALKDGRLAAVSEEAKKLPEKAAQPARDWLAKVEARANVDRAITAIEASLKASLAAAPEPSDTIKK